MMSMQRIKKEQNRDHPHHHQQYRPPILQRKPAKPQQQTTSAQTDDHTGNINGTHPMHHMRNNVDEKCSSKEASEIVVPLHPSLLYQPLSNYNSGCPILSPPDRAMGG